MKRRKALGNVEKGICKLSIDDCENTLKKWSEEVREKKKERMNKIYKKTSLYSGLNILIEK